MNDTQYTTLLQLITNVSSRIDSLLPAVKNEMKRHERQCDKRHLELMKVLEAPFLDHEKRIKEIELAFHLQ